MTTTMLNADDMFEDFSDTDNEDENGAEGGNNEGYKSDDSIQQDVLEDLQRAAAVVDNTSYSVLDDSHASDHPLFDLSAAFTASLSSSDRIHDNFIAKNSTSQQYRTIKQKSQHESSHRKKKRLLEEMHRTIKQKSHQHHTKKNNDTTIVTATTADDNSSYGDNNTELSLQFLRSQVSTPETIRNEAMVREGQRAAAIEDTAGGSSSSGGESGGGEQTGRIVPQYLGTPVEDFNEGTAQPPNGRIDTMDDPMDYLQIGTTTSPHPKTKKENGNITNTGSKRADAAAVGNNNHDDSIPFEITIIDEYPTTTTTTSNHAEGPTLCVLEQIKEVEHQVQFLRSKLDQSNDIIESNFRDMEKARHFIHNLVQRNVQLQTQLSTRTHPPQPPPHSANPGGGAAATNALDNYERGEIRIESYWLLKGALYVSLGLYLLGSHELFLAMIIFVWLLLEQQ